VALYFYICIGVACFVEPSFAVVASLSRLTGSHHMRLILALLVPWLQFFTIGKPFSGIICLILQITLIGWIPAAIWSVYALSQYNTAKQIERSMYNR
jgi:uncharacterized membrane protein YqaE (UPF0057 family)